MRSVDRLASSMHPWHQKAFSGTPTHLHTLRVARWGSPQLRTIQMRMAMMGLPITIPRAWPFTQSCRDKDIRSQVQDLSTWGPNLLYLFAWLANQLTLSLLPSLSCIYLFLKNIRDHDHELFRKRFDMVFAIFDYLSTMGLFKPSLTILQSFKHNYNFTL